MILVIAAMKEELAEYIARGRFCVLECSEKVTLYQSTYRRDVVIALTGVGRKRAEDATALAVMRLEPDLAISTGFAGAAQPGLETGELVLCDTVMAVEGPADCWAGSATPAKPAGDAGLRERVATDIRESGARCFRGGCLSVPEIVLNSSAKRRIGVDYKVSIVDMESYWVSRIAAEHRVPCLVLRSVLDTVEQSLPSFVGSMPANGSRSRRSVLGQALARPGELPGLVRLARQARVARASLARALFTLAPGILGSPDATIDNV